MKEKIYKGLVVLLTSVFLQAFLNCEAYAGSCGGGIGGGGTSCKNQQYKSTIAKMKEYNDKISDLKGELSAVCKEKDAQTYEKLENSIARIEKRRDKYVEKEVGGALKKVASLNEKISKSKNPGSCKCKELIKEQKQYNSIINEAEKLAPELVKKLKTEKGNLNQEKEAEGESPL